MEPIKDITQNEINEIINNPVEQAGNKIKLRSVSHKNLVKHLINIPYKTMPGPRIKSSKINLPKEVVEWKITPKQYMNYVNEGRKPINVKETMLENIKKHSEIADVKEEVTVVPIETEVNESVQQEAENKEPEVGNDLNIEKMYENISNIRQQVLSKKAEADQAQKEADESDKVVQELGVQYTEAQKQLQEAKLRKQEKLIKLSDFIKYQTETLANQTKQYDDLIAEANKRKEANMNMTIGIQSGISSTQDETATINNDIARLDEYLNATSPDNIIDFSQPIDDQEEKIRKIA